MVSVASRLMSELGERAGGEVVRTLSLGLGYTAVCTMSGGIGVAYTPLEVKGSCSALGPEEMYESGPAAALLAQLGSAAPLRRAMGLALANALVHRDALDLPEDKGNNVLLERLQVARGTRVAMVGCIRPLVARLEGLGGQVEVVDEGKHIGTQERFRACLEDWAEVLIMTSTAIINGSADELLQRVKPHVRVALVGPSTPLAAAAFAGLPVHALAGTVPLDEEATLRAVRHGHGTPVLQRFGRKVCVGLRDGLPGEV
jgi:uncharacterized protein